MSFGSEMSVSYMPDEILEVIFKVFESVPYNIVLKWNGDIPKELPGNVRFEKWVPQRDLLCKIYAFLNYFYASS